MFPKRSTGGVGECGSTGEGDSCGSDALVPLPPAGPGGSLGPPSPTLLHSVEVKLQGDVFECGFAVKVCGCVQGRALDGVRSRAGAMVG